MEKTVEVLRTLAPILAPDAGLKPNEFRLRFFKDTYDPVQAWHLQLFMRDVVASDTHAELVHAGRRLAATISNVGEEGWKLLLGRAVATFVPPKEQGAAQLSPIQAQYAVPVLPLPPLLPPVFRPGTRENNDFTDATIEGLRKIGRAIVSPFESRRHDEEDDDEDENRRRRPPRVRPQPSQPAGAAGQDGETRDKPPPGSRPINQTPWSGDHTAIKKGIGAKADDDVRISPDGEAWVKKPDGTWTNRGPVDSHTGSGEPLGRTGRDRDRRPGS